MTAARVVAVGLALAVAMAPGRAHAGPGTVLVLPLEGNADAGLRTKYSASVQRLARVLDGKVSLGGATFTESATAVGCDPQASGCAEIVRATLDVDELIYGSVTLTGGELVLVVRRAAKGKPPREVSTPVRAAESPERAEPAILPLFHSGGRAVELEPVADPDPVIVDDQPPVVAPAVIAPPKPPRPTRRGRTLGIAAIVGGGTMVLIGVALWSSAAGIQDDISSHPTRDAGDFRELVELEDRMATRAWAGNLMFVGGLAVGGLGGWLLYRDRKARRSGAIVAPVPMPGGGAGLAVRWGGGLR